VHTTPAHRSTGALLLAPAEEEDGAEDEAVDADAPTDELPTDAPEEAWDALEATLKDGEEDDGEDIPLLLEEWAKDAELTWLPLLAPEDGAGAEAEAPWPDVAGTKVELLEAPGADEELLEAPCPDEELLPVPSPPFPEQPQPATTTHNATHHPRLFIGARYQRPARVPSPQPLAGSSAASSAGSDGAGGFCFLRVRDHKTIHAPSPAHRPIAMTTTNGNHSGSFSNPSRGSTHSRPFSARMVHGVSVDAAANGGNSVFTMAE